MTATCAGRRIAPYEHLAQIDARVVSANTPGLVTIDSGFKSMATESGPPMILRGAAEAPPPLHGRRAPRLIAPEASEPPTWPTW